MAKIDYKTLGVSEDSLKKSLGINQEQGDIEFDKESSYSHINFRIPKDLKIEILKRALKQKTTISTILLEIVKEYINSNPLEVI